MRFMRFGAVALAAGLMLTACGGGDGNQASRVSYSKLVSFGDSLSDVGSYAVSGVAAVGGGKFTVNGSGNRIWVELLADQAGVAAPCAAQTGLNAIASVVGFAAVTATNHAGCYAYAQGGARVTGTVGPGNVALFNAADSSTYGNAIGMLTDPVVNQITRHLAASGGSFSGDELVTVLAGANDIFYNLSVLSATVKAGGDQTTAATAAVTAVATAAGQLGAYVKQMIVAKGATHVVVANLPDISNTPMGRALSDSSRALLQTMVSTFNSQLASAVAGEDKILLVDVYSVDHDQAIEPAQYGLSNITTPACDSTKVGSSLLCSSSTLVTGATSTWKYADSVHPTPYGYQLLAQLVAKTMAQKGWL